MQKGNLAKWTNIPACINLLFFSELVNELLFDYSIPSNRISTLNSHYLCDDAINTISSIENHGVPEGTLKPIMEELYTSLKKDPIYNKTTDNPMKYFVKYINDHYRISSNISDLNYLELTKTARALNSHFFADQQYYELLKSKIIELVVANRVDDQPNLFRLVKSLLTELVNFGYNPRYIYSVMNNNYWQSHSSIDTPDLILNFFSAFSLAKNEYTVVFVINKIKMSKLNQHIDDLICKNVLSPKLNSVEERKFLDKENDEAFLILKRNAYDAYSAAEAAIQMILINTAFYRLCDHSYRYDIRTAKCGVYFADQFVRVRKQKSAVSHTKMPSISTISESMNTWEIALNSAVHRNSFQDCFSIITAALFHSHSLDSTSEQNQLLDMWAIFESVLDVSNKHTSDRIQQICIYLVPILKRKYIYSLFSQLANDIKNYSEQNYEQIIKQANNDENIIQNICEFIILEENKGLLNIFLESCNDYPLLKERIKYYAEVLATPNQVYMFVEKHAERVRWQIMRIYRNRNLIIHNGAEMPYLHLLIENLHSYVDDFLSYTIHNLSKEHTVNSMCQELFAKECEWIADFSNKKDKMDADAIKKMLSF